MSLNIQNKGFTLVETLVALAVISTALMGVSSLIIANIFNARAVQHNLVAGNLVQEGLEVVRAIRDNDWLSGNNFGDALPDGLYRVQWNDLALRPIDINPELRLDKAVGVYSYDSGDPTGYKRTIVIEQISSVEIKILTIVEWENRGRAGRLEAESHLFDWF